MKNYVKGDGGSLDHEKGGKDTRLATIQQQGYHRLKRLSSRV